MAGNEVVYAQQRWEYVAVVKRTEAALEKELNELGQGGWELVSVHCGKDRKGELAWTAFVKRPVSGQPLSPSAAASAGQARKEAAPEAPEPEMALNPQGFDLSGEEFAIREEPSDSAPPARPKAKEQS